MKHTFFLILALLLLASCEEKSSVDQVIQDESYPSLSQTVDEPAGSNCEHGGKKIELGKDYNGNGHLESDEITSVNFACNESGAEGDFSALVDILNLDFGSQECPLGGNKVVQGLDTNKNDVLDQNEIKESETILNCLRAEDFAELSRVEDLAFGSGECALGGERTFKGRDIDSSGSLEESEILSTTVSCKSDTDFNSLVVIKELPVKDPHCSLGGKETLSGFDYNGNGVLDDDEVVQASTVYNCYTASDYTQLQIESSEPMGGNCGIYGGTKVEKGLDYNKDGLLSPDEIDPSLTSYSCLGAGDFNTLIVVTEEPFGSADCVLGGKRTDTGLDLNKDTILDVAEIGSTVFDCYSPDHFNLLNKTTEEPSGSNCSLGGKKVEQGRDYNSNGVFDENELTATLYSCYTEIFKINFGANNSNFGATAAGWNNTGMDIVPTAAVALYDTTGSLAAGVKLAIPATSAGTTKKMPTTNDVSVNPDFPTSVMTNAAKGYSAFVTTGISNIFEFTGLSVGYNYTFKILSAVDLATAGYTLANAGTTNVSVVGTTTVSSSINPIDNDGTRLIEATVQPTAEGKISIVYRAPNNWNHCFINAVIIMKDSGT